MTITSSACLRPPPALILLPRLPGLVSFVLSLKRGMYLYQFSQYGWTHMIILTVIVPTSFFVSNTFQVRTGSEHELYSTHSRSAGWLCGRDGVRGVGACRSEGCGGKQVSGG